MKKADEIKVVKADIRRLLCRRRYLITKLRKSYSGSPYFLEGFLRGLVDGPAMLERYLKKLEKGS